MTVLSPSAHPVEVGRLRPVLIAVVAPALALVVVLATAAQAQFRCDDTRYHDGMPPDPFTSRYHVLQAYSDVAGHSTDFYDPGYNGVVSATTVRVVVPRLSELVDTKVALPDPYIDATISALKGLNWENRIDASAGIEWRPLKRIVLPQNGGLGWLYQIRLYAAAFKTDYFRYRAEDWRPQDDFRVGAELYRECNLYSGNRPNESPLWAEVWGDVSWRRTNFVVNDFRSWTGGLVPKIGVRLPPGAEVALMPYVTGELDATQRTEPWQNRLLLGAGLRLMPFRWHSGPFADLLRGGRVYGEEVWLVHEFSPSMGAPPPARDFRLGVTFVMNRWH